MNARISLESGGFLNIDILNSTNYVLTPWQSFMCELGRFSFRRYAVIKACYSAIVPSSPTDENDARFAPRCKITWG